MGKLFGTDGIRGIVGENLTADLAFRVGQAVTHVLTEEKGGAPLITIGMDTRISSDMLEGALIAGICSAGGDVMPLGTIPTPAVAYLTVKVEADAGIVISASHNPFAGATSSPTLWRSGWRRRSSPERIWPQPRARTSASGSTG